MAARYRACASRCFWNDTANTLRRQAIMAARCRACASRYYGCAKTLFFVIGRQAKNVFIEILVIGRNAIIFPELGARNQFDRGYGTSQILLVYLRVVDRDLRL